MPETDRPAAVSGQFPTRGTPATGASRGLRWALIIGIVAAAFAAGVVAATLPRTSSAAPAPAIRGNTATGTSFDLASTRGGWVLLNFFASWCTACRTEIPALAQLQHLHPEGLRVISVDTDDSMSAAAQLVRSAGGSWTIVNDPDAASAYHVVGLPESFLVDPAGAIADRIVGAVRTSDVTARLR